MNIITNISKLYMMRISLSFNNFLFPFDYKLPVLFVKSGNAFSDC